MRLVKAKLSEPSIKPSTVIKCLAFSIFSELSGYKAEFAHIHAVKLAQYGSLAEKKMGNVFEQWFVRKSTKLFRYRLCILRPSNREDIETMHPGFFKFLVMNSLSDTECF